MGRKTISSSGQAALEATLAATVLLLFVTLAVGLAENFQTQLKHDFVSNGSVKTQTSAGPGKSVSDDFSTSPQTTAAVSNSNREVNSENYNSTANGDEISPDTTVKKGSVSGFPSLTGNIVFNEKNGRLSLTQLELDGWVKSDSIQVSGNLLYVLSKDDHQMLTDGKIGVIICKTNCADSSQTENNSPSL